MTKDNRDLQQGCIVTFSDVKNPHRTVPAMEIYNALHRLGLWYVRRSTTVKPGTRIFFYRREVGIVGSGTVRESALVSAEDEPILRAFDLSGFSTRIAVDDWVTFAPALKIRTLVNELQFITNKKNWGAKLQLSPLAIGPEDVATLMRAASRET